MKILQIGTADNSGGAASVSWLIKKKMEERGHETPMFVSIKKSTDKNVFIIPKFLHRYFRYFLSNDVDFYNTDWIIKTKEFQEADIVHLHNIHGWFFNLKTLQKMSALKPIVWTLHDMWAITPHCAYSYDCKIKDGFYQCPSLRSYPPIFWHNEKYLMWRKRKVYNNSNFNLVVPSLWLKNKVKESILKDKDTNLIYNGIDTEVFKIYDQKTSRQELGLPLDKKIVMFLSDGGKNNPAKGWFYVESVIEKFNDDNILFLCLGGKESGVDEKHRNLLYIPKIDDKKRLSQFFSASNVFLFPSLADNCPLVILEAMACGTPIVTFETGGIPELVTHLENGYIAKYRDTEDLINGVDHIFNLNDERTYNMISKTRSKVINSFTIDKMVDQYELLYKQIIKNFKR